MSGGFATCSAMAEKFRRNAPCIGGKFMTVFIFLHWVTFWIKKKKKMKKGKLLKRYKFVNYGLFKSTAWFLFNIHPLPFNRPGIHHNVRTQWLQNSQIDGHDQWRERRRCLATRSDFPSVIQQSKWISLGYLSLYERTFTWYSSLRLVTLEFVATIKSYWNELVAWANC